MKTLRNLLLGFVMLLATATLLLHIPIVQRKLIHNAFDYLYQKTGYQITYHAIRLDGLCTISMLGLELKDRNHQPLVVMNECSGHINLLDLLLLKPSLLDAIIVNGATCFLAENAQQDLNINLFYNQVIAPLLPEERSNFSIKKIQLHGIQVYYHNPSDPPAQSRDRYVEDIHLNIENFVSSTQPTHCYAGLITRFSYGKSSLLPIVLDHLKTAFTITSTDILLQACQLVTPYSCLQGDFNLKQLIPFARSLAAKETTEAMEQQIKNLQLEAVFKETTLSSIELSLFIDFFKELDHLYRLDGTFSLTHDAIAWSNGRLKWGSSANYIESSGKVHKTAAHLATHIHLHKGRVQTMDLTPYLKGSVHKLVPYIVPLDYIAITDLQFMNDHNRATLVGGIMTHAGGIQTHLTLEGENIEAWHYYGKIKLDKLALYKFVPHTFAQTLSTTLTINGKGIHPHSATIEALADGVEIETTTGFYNHITAQCTLANHILSFGLKSQDPSADFNLAGSYNIGNQKDLKIEGIVNQCHLASFFATQDPVAISTQFTLTMPHIFKKKQAGQLMLSQCNVAMFKEKIRLKTLNIEVVNQGEQQLLTLTSPALDLQLSGLFTIDSLRDHLKQFIRQFKHPEEQLSRLTKINLIYRLTCKEFTPLACFFKGLYLAPATTLLGHFNYHTSYDFALHLPNPSNIGFKQFRFDHLTIDLVVSHLNFNKKRAIQLNISSKEQHWHKKLKTDNWFFQLLVDQDNLTIMNNLSISAHNSHLAMTCSGDLVGDAIQLHLLPSTFSTPNKIWKIQTKQTTMLTKDSIKIGDLSITHGKQSLFIGGELTSAETTNPLHCVIENFGLNFFSAAIEGNLAGLFDANLILHRSGNNLMATGKASIKKCRVKGIPIGSFYTTADWNVAAKKLSIEAMLQKKGHYPLQVYGDYYPLKTSNSLNLTALLNTMDLSFLDVLVAPTFSKIKGTLSGKFMLTGTRADPQLNGRGIIDQGQLQIDYINTLYQVKGVIEAKKNRLHLSDCHWMDHQNGSATLTGSMVLEKGFPLMLSGRVEDLHLLHTTVEENSDFYGSIYATGTLQLEGPIKDLVLKANLTANRGRFTIISDDRAYLDDASVLVRFIDKTHQKPLPHYTPETVSKDATNFNFLLNLTILPVVKTIVLWGSYNSKDVIKGYGSGMVQLEVGTNRKPYIMGNYVFNRGTFIVSVYNLIQKKFTIIKNSQIAFNGYPQEGIVHIEASYTQMASVKELTDENIRPIPVEIVLTAHGVLATPHIDYRLVFPEKSTHYPLNTKLETCMAKTLLDKSYLNKQILSLLVAKRLYNDSEIDGWNAIRTSLNDFFSQKIQGWLSKIDQNLEIETDFDIGYGKPQQGESLKKTSIKVIYKTLSGRLKLSSTFSESSTLLNDWEICYTISKADGISAKVYHQPFDRQPSLLGLGFVYTRTFRK
ncbi:MAG: translocation/assembly module TamB [Amoebophilaceae bacterium]|nr:translocation/assembly module TamB [Amoebophilaceae bacterium]